MLLIESRFYLPAIESAPLVTGAESREDPGADDEKMALQCTCNSRVSDSEST